MLGRGNLDEPAAEGAGDGAEDGADESSGEGGRARRCGRRQDVRVTSTAPSSDAAGSGPGPREELAAEQGVLDDLYRRLELARAHAERELRRARSGATAGTPGALAERDAFAALYQEQLASFEAAEQRLCFGRLDLQDGQLRYVGRVGLSDEEQHPLLIDWRAPAAEPFYQATAVEPMGVVRRRHIQTAGRTVTSLEDDVLDLEAMADDAHVVQGGGALMAALGAERTGRMRDIVATIQAEQDRIIRSPLPGVLVVEGGPGCGKTVVALHRAAYLLFTHRNRIARSGVLVVGPNQLFLRYIESGAARH